MTEAEWLICGDPKPMLAYVRGKTSDRKLRLFACALYLRVWHWLANPRSREAVMVAERFADGLATAAELKAAYQAAALAVMEPGGSAAHRSAKVAVEHAIQQVMRLTLSWRWDWELRQHADLVRDLLGNPFRPARLDSSCLEWNGGCVRQLAHALYQENRYRDFAILGDALEEAGCLNTEILAHCREPGPHARGCWVLDLLLGKM